MPLASLREIGEARQIIGSRNALSFDGLDDMVTTPVIPFLDADPWTYQEWMKWEGNLSTHIWHAGQNNWVAEEVFRVRDSSVNRLSFSDKNHTGHHFGESDSIIDSWVLLSWVADGAGNLTLYVGDTSRGTLGGVPTQLHFSKIGKASPGAGGYGLKGQIAQACLSNIARTQAEITANWNGGLGRQFTKDTNTVALWLMNEGSGSTIYDETDNHNDGIINEATWVTHSLEKGRELAVLR